MKMMKILLIFHSPLASICCWLLSAIANKGANSLGILEKNVYICRLKSETGFQFSVISNQDV